MGHCHTPEERRSTRSVHRVDGGLIATAAKPVESLQTRTQHCSCPEREKPTQRQSVAVQMALFALRFYKAYLSMLFAGSCRFEPTCSRYSYEAIQRFGVVRGSWLTLKRLLRCQPLSRSFGFDPVPERWDDLAETSPAGAYQAGASPQAQNEVAT